MNGMSYRRLRTPVFALALGILISTAVGIHQNWIAAAIDYFISAIVAVIYFFVGRKGQGDPSTVVGGRADERQELVRLKAGYVAVTAAVVAAGIGCLVLALVKATIWPYIVIIDVAAVAYLIALSAYGVTLPSTESRVPQDD